MKASLTIGRSRRCDIIIPYEKISRQHARISVVGGQYVYEDIGKNGSVIGGRIIHGERVLVAAGTEILLAGRVPLPWTQVYSMLPLHGVHPFDGETKYEPHPMEQNVVSLPDEDLGVGWCVLAFLFPIAGWLMYFSYKDESPRKASQANTIAWVSFVIGVVLYWAAL